MNPDWTRADRSTATEWPRVSAVIPTLNRPQLLVRAVDSVLAQEYRGAIDVIVVVDRRGPDTEVPDFDDPRVTVVDNGRRKGLAGARNTGALLAGGELIAFCDDDDTWKPTKLVQQVEALALDPSAGFATCSVEVEYDGRHSVRLAGSDRVTHDQLLDSRLPMLHSSTFLIRQDLMQGELGLVDEDVPASQGEDWDYLLRASRLHPIVHVDRPLVTVQWNARSYFSRDWDTKIMSLQWMLQRYPRMGERPIAAARIYGQIAFAYAASKSRRAAVRWARRSIAMSWREPRAYLAMAVAAGVPSDVILRGLNRRGHGL